MINLRSKIGIKLELEIINSLGEKIGQAYVSQLMDVSDDNNIIIAAPIHESRLMLITPGTRIRIVFLDDKHSLMSFTGIISSRDKREGLILFNVKTDGDFVKIQRRNYFRLDCILNIGYFLCESDPNDEQAEPKPLGLPNKAVTRNISGNGACIVTDEEIQKGSLLNLTIWFNKEIFIKAIGKIIRCSRIESTKGNKYESGMYFTRITQKDQDVLIKYIFDQQRLLLKNSIADKI